MVYMLMVMEMPRTSSIVATTMRAGSCLLIALAGVSVMANAATVDDDVPPAFLERTFPNDIVLEPVPIPSPDGKGGSVMTPMMKIPSFHRGVELLSLLAGKKVELLDGLGEWPHESDELVSGGAYGVVKGQKIGELFQSVSINLGLDWRYDPLRDIITLSPSWLRADSRSGSTLVNVLNTTPLVRWDKLPKGERNRVGGVGFILDPWRVAFDALASRPDNLGTAGTLRIYHNCHGGCGLWIFPVSVLYCARQQGDDGRARTLVLIEQERISNKSGAGDLAFYIFDDEGHFTHGGVYGIAGNAEAGMQKCESRAPGDISIDVGYGSFGLNPDHYQFDWNKDNFTFTGSIGHAGNKMNVAESQAAFPYGKIAELNYDVRSHVTSRGGPQGDK